MKKTLITITSFAFLLGGTALGADKDAKQDAKQKQQETKTRKQMAKAHENMANCLKGDKSMDQCRQEMREHCRQEDDCMMMQMGGMRGKKHMGGKGHMRGGGAAE